jgi:hypothetical protein
MLNNEIEHFYVFYTNGGDNVYERTCGDEDRAKERVEELKKLYENAEYFKNEIPKEYKWFY